MSADMSQVIIPKSDQINADDFIVGPRSYVIESVAIRPGTEQPVSIRLAGERKVWRPCKSMCRVMVAAWGPDANAYAGRSVTLYRDPKVKWGGLDIGGIRISHMSHIERDMLLQLTETKGKRSPHVIKPLAVRPAPRAPEPEQPVENKEGFFDDFEPGLRVTDEEANSIREWLDATSTDKDKFLAAFGGANKRFPGPRVSRIEDMTPKQYEAAILAFESKAKPKPNEDAA